MNYSYWNETGEDYEWMTECADITPLIIAISILGTSLLISEVLPFLSGHRGNGIADFFVLLLRASSCVIDTCLELDSKGKAKARAEAHNSVNININNAARASPSPSNKLLIKNPISD